MMISIIIPVYNTKKYIKRAFNSLLNQSIGFNNLEIIFIDDNSTDGSKDLIQDYQDKYENVKSIFLNKNSGSGGKPRNIGLSHATHDFIMFLDSDDKLMTDACEVLYDEISNEDVDIVSGMYTWDDFNPFNGLWLAIFTDPFQPIELRKNKVNDILNNDFPLKINSIDDCPSIIGDYGFVTKIYRKSFLEKNSINFPENIIAEDSVFLLNALLNAKGIKYIDNIVYYYAHERHNDDDLSMSNIHSKKVLKGLLDAFYKMNFLCIEKNKSDIFKKYLLYQKLNYFLNSRLLKSNLNVDDVIELLVYAQPLFKSCVDFNKEINNSLFIFIANKEYEKALKVLFG